MRASKVTVCRGNKRASMFFGDRYGGSQAGSEKERMGSERNYRFHALPSGLFTKSASTIAKSLASKEVSPKGPVSGLRMLNYFINRAGKQLSKTRRAELENAKTLLSNRIHKEKEALRRREA